MTVRVIYVPMNSVLTMVLMRVVELSRDAMIELDVRLEVRLIDEVPAT